MLGDGEALRVLVNACSFSLQFSFLITLYFCHGQNKTVTFHWLEMHNMFQKKNFFP